MYKCNCLKFIFSSLIKLQLLKTSRTKNTRIARFAIKESKFRYHSKYMSVLNNSLCKQFKLFKRFNYCFVKPNLLYSNQTSFRKVMDG